MYTPDPPSTVSTSNVGSAADRALPALPALPTVDMGDSPSTLQTLLTLMLPDGDDSNRDRVPSGDFASDDQLPECSNIPYIHNSDDDAQLQIALDYQKEHPYVLPQEQIIENIGTVVNLALQLELLLLGPEAPELEELALQGLQEALTPLSEIDIAADVASSAAESASTDGTATVLQHSGTHFSVSVTDGEGVLQTHQVIMGDQSVTNILTATQVDPGPVIGSASMDVDAAAAMARQQELMNAGNLGPYDRITNSCVSHVNDVLNSGGIQTPQPNGSDQLRFLLRLIKEQK